MNLQDAWRYHQWATERTLESCEKLSFEELTKDLGGSFPSLRETLVHCLFADGVWFHRVQGLAYTKPKPEDFSSVSDLKAAWQPLFTSWIGLIDQTDPEKVLQYSALDGQPFKSSFEEIVRHVVNHGSYHRGQVAMMLRLLGHAPIQTDWIVMTRSARQ